MTPALVKLVAERRFPALRAQARCRLVAVGGCGRWAPRWSALAAGRAQLPLWLVPPLVLILPPLIWGWLTYRVMAFDVLAEHASADERRALMREHRWPLLAIGVGHRLPGRGAGAGVGVERRDARLRAVAGACCRSGCTRWCSRSPRSGSRTTPRRAAPRPPAVRSRCRRAGSAGAPKRHRRCRRYEIRPHHRRRRNPVRQARRQAPAQGHRTARRARPAAGLGRYVGDDRAAHHRRAARALRQRRRGVLLRRHRRHARRPHAPVRRRGARRAAGAASAGARR